MISLQLVLDITYYLTIEEVNRPLRLCRILLRVRHHYDGRALGIQFPQQVHHFLAVLGVQVAGGLIGENQLRPGHYGTGDGNALLLTAGELLRKMLGTVADGHALHDIRDLGLALGGRYVQIPKRQLNVLIHIEFVDQVEALEHEADVAFAELGTLFLLEAADLGAEEFIGTTGGIVQQAQNVQQRGLAAARRPHDGHELAVFDFKRDAIQRRGLDLFRAEDLGEVGYLNHIYGIYTFVV